MWNATSEIVVACVREIGTFTPVAFPSGMGTRAPVYGLTVALASGAPTGVWNEKVCGPTGPGYEAVSVNCTGAPHTAVGPRLNDNGSVFVPSAPETSVGHGDDALVIVTPGVEVDSVPA